MSSIVLSGDTSGQVSLTVPAVAGSNTVTIPAGTGTAAVQGVSTNIVQSTVAPTTSGTSVSYLNIPSWVKRITVIFQGVSTNSATNPILIQLGSGSTTTSGYTSVANYYTQSSTTNGTTRSDSFFLTYVSGAADVISGQMVISNITGNTWVESATFRIGTTTIMNCAGEVALSGTLDRVVISVSTGAFDLGQINILYE
jgi:hypothetical protein